MEVYSMLMAKKNAIKSTVLEHLSGRVPDMGNGCESRSYGSLPMVLLVGPPKTGKKKFLNQIFEKHRDKFYRAFIHTTNINTCTKKMFKTIGDDEFNRMNCAGKFVFSYRLLGYSYGLSRSKDICSVRICGIQFTLLCIQVKINYRNAKIPVKYW